MYTFIYICTYMYVCANIFSALGTAFVHATLNNINFIKEIMLKEKIYVGTLLRILEKILFLNT